MKDENQLTTAIAEIYYKDGILFSAFLPVSPTLEEVKLHTLQLNEHFKDILPALVVTDISQLKQTTKEVRDFFASDEMSITMAKAAAIITNSPFAKILGNLFMKFNKPAYPCRMFSKQEKAVEWINRFK